MNFNLTEKKNVFSELIGWVETGWKSTLAELKKNVFF